MDNNYQWPPESSGKPPKKKPNFKKLKGSAAIVVLVLFIAMGALAGTVGSFLREYQTVVNIGMCLFVMPVIGVTLPFFSYGGSSIVTLYIAMGIVSGIKKRASTLR